ncbi:Tas Predicted oxidoreductases (related to aryl-alcohol dehydrogenases) [Candidatus Nanopelagicaceae bacterium]
MSKSQTNILTLGTANIGQSYGITNGSKYDIDQAKRILSNAIQLNITSFDTSPEYGYAENLIGDCFARKSKFSVTTKIPKYETYTRSQVIQTVELSLKKMNINKIDNLLFHDPEIYKLTNLAGITETLLESGKVGRIGFSAYHADHILEAKEKNPCWSVFQIPENILDQRFKYSKELVTLKEADNLIYVRSAFLQGLLLVSPAKLPKFFADQKETFEGLHKFSLANNLSVLEICLSYMASIEWNHSTVIGAGSNHQLNEIIGSQIMQLNFDGIATLPDLYLDPRNWETIAS